MLNRGVVLSLMISVHDATRTSVERIMKLHAYCFTSSDAYISAMLIILVYHFLDELRKP